MIHWAVAVPFLVCLSTAAVLVLVYNPDPHRPLRALVSWAHRIAGIGLITFPVLTAWRHRRDGRLYWANIKEAWSWSVNDVKWLSLAGLAAVSKRVKLPEEGKFNAGEKLNFMAVTISWPLMMVTGILVWMPGVAFVSWIVHVGAAAAILPLTLGHLFMAVVNPSSRVGLSGMITGYVDRGWAAHHYRRWFRQNFGAERPRTRPVPKPPPRPVPAPTPIPATLPSRPAPPVVRCPHCRAENRTISWAHLVDAAFSAHRLECSSCGLDIGAISVVNPEVDLAWMLQKLEEGPVDLPPAPRGDIDDVLGMRSWSEKHLPAMALRESTAST